MATPEHFLTGGGGTVTWTFTHKDTRDGSRVGVYSCSGCKTRTSGESRDAERHAGACRRAS